LSASLEGDVQWPWLPGGMSLPWVCYSHREAAWAGVFEWQIGNWLVPKSGVQSDSRKTTSMCHFLSIGHW
jgi:hypothetical protein